MLKNLKLVVLIGGGFAVVLVLTAIATFISWKGPIVVVDGTDKEPANS
ncbi:MAG: hypothetical protein GY866_39970 [Proteobacteria bacterium]|nr:hypothetical protein [Pseudomonadota bacterium]